ncbi:hypothetical protein ACFYZB_17020 [Streptomyces sp. NPDC001852]
MSHPTPVESPDGLAALVAVVPAAVTAPVVAVSGGEAVGEHV